MPENSDKPEVIIMSELPAACDGCGAIGMMEPIHGNTHSALGKRSLVIGYHCMACQGSFLYQK